MTHAECTQSSTSENQQLSWTLRWRRGAVAVIAGLIALPNAASCGAVTQESYTFPKGAAVRAQPTAATNPCGSLAEEIITGGDPLTSTDKASGETFIGVDLTTAKLTIPPDGTCGAPVLPFSPNVRIYIDAAQGHKK